MDGNRPPKEIGDPIMPALRIDSGSFFSRWMAVFSHHSCPSDGSSSAASACVYGHIVGVEPLHCHCHTLIAIDIDSHGHGHHGVSSCESPLQPGL